MATASRRTVPSLEDMLFDSGYKFEFFQAVRLLTQLYPASRLVGGAARPSQESVRFTVWPPEQERLSTVVSFPASSIDIIQRPLEAAGGKPAMPPRMTVMFFGLTGIQGVLPMHYTDMLIMRKGQKDHALADFFDLFNHRLISLFYRAWAKHKVALIRESAVRAKQSPDPFTHYVFDLIGLGTDAIRGGMQVPDEALLPYAGLIAQRPHSATAIRAILRDYFAVPVEIEQCLGGWYELAEADRSYMRSETESNQLGVGAFLGDKVWNQQDRFRIRVGPVKRKRFLEFLPDGGALRRLIELTRFLVGQALAFDVQVVMEKDEVPDCRLTQDGDAAPRLGWMSWLKTETHPFPAPATEAIFVKAVSAVGY